MDIIENNCSDWINGITAVSTFFLGVIAIYGEKIRSYLFQPKIVVEIDNVEPCVTEKSNSGSSSDSSQNNSILIQFRLKNTNSNNTDCHCFVSEYWTMNTSNGTYAKTRSFVPLPLYWDDNETPSGSLNQVLESYVRLAVIQHNEILTGSQSSEHIKHTSKTYELYIHVQEPNEKGKLVKLGCGTFILPVTILFGDSKHIIAYIKICWEKATYEDWRKNFSIQKLTHRQLPKELKA